MDDPLLRGLDAMHQFNTAIDKIRTAEGVSPGELEIIAGNILDLAEPEAGEDE